MEEQSDPQPRRRQHSPLALALARGGATGLTRELFGLARQWWANLTGGAN